MCFITNNIVNTMLLCLYVICAIVEDCPSIRECEKTAKIMWFSGKISAVLFQFHCRQRRIKDQLIRFVNHAIVLINGSPA